MLLRTCLPGFCAAPSTAWTALLARQTAVLRNGIVTHRHADSGRVDVVRDKIRSGNGRNSRFLNPGKLIYKHVRAQPAGWATAMVTGGPQGATRRMAANSERGFQ